MRTLLLMTMMIFASTSFAGLYKWVDNEGNVTYSQKPPREKQYKRLKAPNDAPENAKPLYPSTKLRKSKSTTLVTTQTARNEKIRATNCRNAKNNLNSYQLTRRVRDEDGNVTIVDDKERALQIDKAKNAINQFCN